MRHWLEKLYRKFKTTIFNMAKGPVKRVEERLKLQKKPNMTRLEIKKR